MFIVEILRNGDFETLGVSSSFSGALFMLEGYAGRITGRKSVSIIAGKIL